MKAVMTTLSRQLIPAVLLSSLTAGFGPGLSPGLRARAQEAGAGRYRQSPLKAAPQVTDLAIDGPGYFRLLDPRSKAVYYTRNGDFHWDGQGRLVNAQGYLIQPEVVAPGGRQIAIAENGNLYARKAEPPPIWEEQARIQLTLFPRPDKLRALGGRAGLFQATAAAGPPEEVLAGSPDAGRIVSGRLEDFSRPLGPPPESGCQSPHPQTNTGRPLDWG